MAARTRRIKVDPRTVEKIRTTQLINRLQNYVLASPADEDFRRKEMTGPQVRAALGLLAKTIPDLNRTTYVGDPTEPVHMVTAAMTPQEAADAYSSTLNGKG